MSTITASHGCVTSGACISPAAATQGRWSTLATLGPLSLQPVARIRAAVAYFQSPYSFTHGAPFVDLPTATSQQLHTMVQTTSYSHIEVGSTQQSVAGGEVRRARGALGLRHRSPSHRGLPQAVSVVSRIVQDIWRPPTTGHTRGRVGRPPTAISATRAGAFCLVLWQNLIPLQQRL